VGATPREELRFGSVHGGGKIAAIMHKRVETSLLEGGSKQLSSTRGTRGGGILPLESKA